MRAVLFLAACVLGAAVVASPAAAAGPPSARCLDPGHNRIFIETDTTIYRQGATVRIIPQFDRMPGGYQAIDLTCLRDWRITGPATLAADRRSFTIAADAPAGSEILLSYRWHDERAEARMRVVARDAVVLTGTRGQRSAEGCEQMDPVRELQFQPGDHFSVTFTPFESYKDYWGSYSFDPATGTLSMHVEGGNNVPPGLDLDGRATMTSDGRLILEGMYLGSGHGVPPMVVNPATSAAELRVPACRYIF
jgi:hypothetical protein